MGSSLSVMIALVWYPLEIAFMSLCSGIARFKGIVPVMARRASYETVLYALVIKLRTALWIYLSLSLALVDIELYQASAAYVMVGRRAFWYMVRRLW